MTVYKTSNHSKYSCNNDFFSKDNESSFYWAGFIAADGCIYDNPKNKKSKRLQVVLSIKDIKHLRKLKLILQATNPIHEYTYFKKYKGCRLIINSKQIVQDLKRFNIKPKKSLTYTIPKWIIDHPLIHHFIRGYIDGDGCFYIMKRPEGPQIGFSVLGTKQCLIELRKIFYKECNLRLDQTISHPSKIYELKYGGNRIVNKLLNYLYHNATIFLPRKYNIASISRRRGKSRKLDNTQVQNIKLLFFKGANNSDIAKQFDVSRGHINKIRNGHIWKNI